MKGWLQSFVFSTFIPGVLVLCQNMVQVCSPRFLHHVCSLEIIYTLYFLNSQFHIVLVLAKAMRRVEPGAVWACLGCCFTPLRSLKRVELFLLPTRIGDGLQSGRKRCTQRVWGTISVLVSGAVWHQLRSVSQWEWFLYVNHPLFVYFCY